MWWVAWLVPAAYGGKNMSKIEISTIETELKRLVLWHKNNRSLCGTPEEETNEQAWSRGFNAGYESGRLSLIKELLGHIEMAKLEEDQ